MIKLTTVLISTLLSLSTYGTERYTGEEKEIIQRTLKALDGEQLKCVASFMKGYEVYTYPHCTQYNSDKEICKKYKNSVPTSVVDTAFHICSVNWQLNNG